MKIKVDIGMEALDHKLSILKDSRGSLCSSQMGLLKKLTDAHCFIETGTYLGDTTHSMRSVFDRVVSIELSPELHAAATLRFKNDRHVSLLEGDSAEKMGEALAIAGNDRSIIWLDAHWSGGNTAKAEGNTPILSEIRAVHAAGSTDVVILIDDISYFWSARPGFNVHDSIGGYPEIDLLLAELRKLNPDFEIFVNGDVMFAIPRPLMSGTNISPVLDATSRLRTGLYCQEELPRLEAVVAGAVSSELGTILRLPEVFSHALSYGIGGHFCYWRGLVHERAGRQDDARRDFNLARKCGVNISLRHWEN